MLSNRLLFLCPDANTPSGGIKQIYRQVDILNEIGYSAFVVHRQISKKVIWFENKTAIGYNEKIFSGIFNKEIKGISNLMLIINKKIKGILNKNQSKRIQVLPNDIIVIPEIWISYFKSNFMVNKVVIFNQNCYYTFGYVNIKNAELFDPFIDKRLLGQIVVSEDSRKYLSTIYDPSRIFRVINGIDESLFNYKLSNERIISFMPRKLSGDSEQIIGILQAKKKINGWSFIAIENMTEQEVALIMQKSAIFLSFSYQEGFGLPAAEAMACGCVVVGYSGRGGNEYFEDEFVFKVNEGDIIDFVTKVESAVNLFESDHNYFDDMGRKASEFILSKYSIKNEASSISNAWDQIMKLVD